MNESTLTVRYAKALFQVGEETGKTEIIRKDIELLYNTSKDSKEFVELLQSPIIKTSQKVKIFNEVFSGKLDTVVLNFFQLLAQNKREQFFSRMCFNFLQLYNQEKGIKEAVFTTAQPL
ncbi:MAG TPA: ATP synthase F1 subunit delta, partial [Bacteroidales bacterium]|nr:ATP synthase F1 subunit delta [Bacteroidales bacterium]